MVGNSGTIVKQHTKTNIASPEPDYAKLKSILARKSGGDISLKQARKIGDFLLRVHEIINKPNELDEGI